MRFALFIASFSALALCALAQDDGLLPNQQCWLECGIEALKTTECGISNNLACVCGAKTYVPTFDACMEKACPGDKGQTDGLRLLQQQCDTLSTTDAPSKTETGGPAPSNTESSDTNSASGVSAHGMSLVAGAVAAAGLLLAL
ncbi:hypothetical protein AURDEDRAFT_155947 [Auricularia subglabra TFB-10046 SS5]|nr:hypothetical protein AURDEDRAFT_155947 [Auricularia subglabra TFB-10046 SS5]